MTLIEGVGDEVTVFVSIIVLLSVLLLAWFSTSVTDRPFVSVIILDGRTFQHFISRLRGRTVVTNTATQRAVDGATPSTSQGDTSSEATTPVSDDGASAQQATEDNSTGITAEKEQSEKSSDQQPEASSRETELTSEPSTTTSTPTSEGFEQLGASGSDSERDSAVTNEHNTTPTVRSEQVSNVQASAPCAPGSSELRQRRLAFYDNAQRTSSNVGQSSSNSSSEARDTSIPTAQSCHSESAVQPSPDIPPQNTSTESVDQAQTSSGESFTSLDGHIRIRIKYLDDRQRWVHARPEETVGQFKRRHFSDEIGENTMVRFIYNGRELTRDGESLASYNVSDESVIHCLISQVRQRNTDNVHGGVVQFDVGALVFPLFGLILGLIWYSRFTYKQYFNTMSTLTLIGITFLFIVALLASFRTHDAPEVTEAN